ncbi:methyl-accepting chemotaxis protein, partial [Phenylobacterium sp.]|uniref:methyl-accepting chemotaxis protein n=1 Tax=Phenylobacterium sp. TaxID=1871053 RepID=UPI002F3F33A7
VYLNATAQVTFARAAGEIRRSVPSFDAQSLPGSSLEALSPDPARERQALDCLGASEMQERTLGALTFRTVSSPVVGDGGERIGTVVEWTDRTQELAVEKQMQTMLSAVVGGDLASRISLDGKAGFFAAASGSINQLADNMAEIVALVKDAAGEVYRGSKEIASGNSNLQHRTEEQSASLEETASSMEQMTTTVRQNADNAGEANQLAVAARDQAEQGGKVVNKAIHAMSDINDSARKIADIIGVVDEIAFQTNLLALNAGVEAARAGDAGRGFAVVASEVRALAQRSAGAAKEIKALISTSSGQVKSGVQLVGQTGEALGRVLGKVGEIAQLTGEIAASAKDQALGLHEVNAAIAQMDHVTQQNAAMVQESTAACFALASETRQLAMMLGKDEREGAAATAQPRPGSAPPHPRAVRRAAGGGAARAVAVEEDGWEEF